MALFHNRRSDTGGGRYSPEQLRSGQSGHSLSTQDTLAAINELSQLVRNYPDLVEIYLALGNLYRAQGEIERAVHIRTSLIVRPGLDPHFKARAFYELGKDYKRGGFMDRAADAFEEAICLAGEDDSILLELARLAALNNDFETAAKRYGQLKNHVAQAHFLVRQAQQFFDAGEDSQGRKLLHKALKVHPGAVEAWLTRVRIAAASANLKKLGPLLQEAFAAIPRHLRFVFLEGIRHQVMEQPALQPYNHNASLPAEHPVCGALLPLLEHEAEGRKDVLNLYYGAMLLLACNERELARTWLEKALLLREDFWPARLEIMDIGLPQHDLLPSFKGQIEFFIGQARVLKRFVCRACGLKREQTFFVCPRCQSWHSIGFRFTLHE